MVQANAAPRHRRPQRLGAAAHADPAALAGGARAVGRRSWSPTSGSASGCRTALRAGDRRLGGVQRGGDGGRRGEPAAERARGGADAALRPRPARGAAVPDRRARQPVRAADHGAGDDQRLGAEPAGDDAARGAAALIITLLVAFYVPLELASGEALALPEVWRSAAGRRW